MNVFNKQKNKTKKTFQENSILKIFKLKTVNSINICFKSIFTETVTMTENSKDQLDPKEIASQTAKYFSVDTKILIDKFFKKGFA